MVWGDEKNKMKDLIAQLLPLHRTLVSDGTDKALKIIGECMLTQASYTIETYVPGESAWTWKIPERYVVHEAYLETEDGQKVVNFNDNPLHLVSYSLPVDRVLKWKELETHLYCSAKRPHAIPWEFKYYERDWGFCLSKEQFDRLPRDKRYHAVIRSEFVTDPEQGLRVGVAVLHPKNGQCQNAGEILICTHVCHPCQANDDLAGVSVAVEVAHRLAARLIRPRSMSVRLLFCPETIGSICYLSYHESLIPRFKGGIFIEMPGNRNSIILQRTRQDSHLMDRVARYVLERKVKVFREGAFREVVRNDEMVINGPGVNIPTISLSRWPYPEWHTSDDNLGIICEDMLEEMADIVEEIVRIYTSNYIPKRLFRGPVFLSAYGLWVDWRINKELNAAIEKIMLRFEGKHSIFDIAQELSLDYWNVMDYVEKFRAKNLVQACPIPSITES